MVSNCFFLEAVHSADIYLVDLHRITTFNDERMTSFTRKLRSVIVAGKKVVCAALSCLMPFLRLESKSPAKTLLEFHFSIYEKEAVIVTKEECLLILKEQQCIVPNLSDDRVCNRVCQISGNIPRYASQFNGEIEPFI